MQFRSRYVRFVALAVLLTAALLLQACTAVTPAGQAGAAPAAAADDSAGKWCKDVDITFFPGGPAGGVFANNVYNGAQQAEADLGPTVSYVFSDWDPQKMIQQFQEVVATSPDGIAVMGHPEHRTAHQLWQISGQRLWLCRRRQLHRRL